MRNHTNSSRAVQHWFIFLFLLLPLHTTQAVPVEDLYVADVLVPDDSALQLRTGARAGLLQVLVRVSGRVDVENSSLVRNALRNPAAYYNLVKDAPVPISKQGQKLDKVLKSLNKD